MKHPRLPQLPCFPLWAAIVALLIANEAKGFSLLGPYADWMTPDRGYHQLGDIGGPMALGEEYRWNVPIVTYGFDKSFLDYFGSNGVAAVEQAIQLLNALPPASALDLNNYPLETEQKNSQAEAQGLSDLKSATLGLLLEQLGLAQPSRHIFDMRELYYTFPYAPYETNWLSWAVPNFILERNFDPETLLPSRFVNQTLYGGYVVGFGNGVTEYLIDPQAAPANAAADRHLLPGGFYTGLTRDDVGALRYLLSGTNVNYESPLSGVVSSARRKSEAAPRRGVEKITFIRHQTNHSGKFKAIVLSFPDSSAQSHTSRKQPARRVVKQPDFLFTAANLGANADATPLFARSDTSNWVNNAALNGNPDGAGPGVIRPPVTITFHKLGPVIETADSSAAQTLDQSWASFDNSAHAPLVYPPANTPAGLSVRLRAYDTTFSFVLGTNRTVVSFPITNEVFHLDIPVGAQAALQTSTNQADWLSVAAVTNSGSVIEWHHRGILVDWSPSLPAGQTAAWRNLVFFRVVPQ